MNPRLKRNFLAALLPFAAILATPALNTLASAQPYSGKTLRVLAFRDNHTSAVEKALPDFEKLTGAKIVLDLIASNAVAAKTTIDQKGGGTYDLYAVDEPFLPQLAPLMQPISAWPAPKLTDAKETSRDQFLPASVAAGTFNNQEYGLPINGNVYMYVYRQDLFNNAEERANFRKKFGYDLAPPKTTKEFADIASFFTRPPTMYGFAPFTKKSEGTTVEALWILSTFGVSIFDEKLNVTVKKESATNAFRFYQDLMQFAPPGAKSWHHSERMTAFSKGKLVQIMTWPSYVGSLEDPSKSLVVGKNAYALPPAAPGGRPSPIAGSWTLAIPKTSQQPELASDFARWWASAQFGRQLVKQGMNPARRDLLTDAELLKTFPYFKGVLTNFESAVLRPRFPDYSRVSDVVSAAFTNMIAGATTPEKAVDTMIYDLQGLQQRLNLANPKK
jgi:multiple sugar transport system substrate-binding protein